MEKCVAGEKEIEMMDVTGKKVLVFGSGISGIGAVKLLETHGAEVVLYDGNNALKAEEVKERLTPGSRAEVVIGTFPEELLSELDLVVLSPGVPTDLPIVEAMKAQKIRVIGEIELAYQYRQRGCAGNYWNEWEDNNNVSSGRDYEELSG